MVAPRRGSVPPCHRLHDPLLLNVWLGSQKWYPFCWHQPLLQLGLLAYGQAAM